MGRQNRKGRSKGRERFAALPFSVMDAPAFAALNAIEQAILLALMYRYNGNNNGTLALSARDAAKWAQVRPNTACAALKRLEELGFITLVTKGGFSRKVRHASEFALNWQKHDVGPEAGKPAPRRYLAPQK